MKDAKGMTMTTISELLEPVQDALDIVVDDEENHGLLGEGEKENMICDVLLNALRRKMAKVSFRYIVETIVSKHGYDVNPEELFSAAVEMIGSEMESDEE
jgi:hypothetical protein